MARPAILAVLAIGMATLAPAQNPSPVSDSDTVLSKALAKLSGTGRRLGRYTCIETVDRSFYSAPSPIVLMTDPSAFYCQGREFSPPGRLALNSSDRVRLEVAVSDGKELASWVSADRFDSRSIMDLVNGPTSTGAFGTVLVDIFENQGTKYTFLGRQGEAFEYAFEVPIEASHYFVRNSDRSLRNTEYHGTFDVDPKTGELIRLVTETADQPTQTMACRYRTAIDYHYLNIGDGHYLLPAQTANDDLMPDGSESHSSITFSACHEYGAQSSLVLGDVPVASSDGAAPKTVPPLPAGLSLTVALANPLDTDTAAAGDVVTARVAKDVRAPHSNQVLVAAGDMVHGRISEMRHDVGSGRFVISIVFETLEHDGAVGPVSLRLRNQDELSGLTGGRGLVRRGTEFTLPAPVSRGETGGLFTLPASHGHALMRAGFESNWITVVK